MSGTSGGFLGALVLAQDGFDTTASWFDQMVNGFRWFVAPAANETSRNTDSLYMMIYWWSLFWFVLLMGLMVYWVIRYRRRPGVAQERSPSHNTLLELFWTIVPSSSLLVIFLLGFWGYANKMVAGHNALRMDLTAWKWGWNIFYPNGAESTWARPLSVSVVDGREERTTRDYPIFVVPAGRNVTLQMSSQDVIHSFWVPAFRAKVDVFPNRYTTYNFTAPELGNEASVGEMDDGSTYLYRDFWIFCAEYCGQDHSEMAAVLRVVSDRDYGNITQSWNTGLPLIELGQQQYQQKCVACHTLDGGSGAGPTWKNKWGYPVPLASGETILADATNEEWAAYIRESILEPNNKMRAGYANGGMNSFQGQLDDRQLAGLTLFIASLSDTELAKQYVSAVQAEEVGEAAPADGEAPSEAPGDAPGEMPADAPADAAADGRVSGRGEAGTERGTSAASAARPGEETES